MPGVSFILLCFFRIVIQEAEYPDIGAVELTLSNGMRICYKSTGFLDDQVIHMYLVCVNI